MDKKAEVSAFLKSRRDRITPEQAGLASYGKRRVPGLRRGEVATLAGMSVEYYTRLERGNLNGVSDSVLDALCKALRLDDTERNHLYTLARAANIGPAPAPRRTAKKQTVRPSVLRIIEGLHDQPAYLRNNRMDLLAANTLGRSLLHEVFDHEPANLCRFVFLDPRAPRLYLDWEKVARNGVGVLRVETAKNPYDRELCTLIGELSARSDAFRTLWAEQDVHTYTKGIKRFLHPAIGEIALSHESLDLPGDDGLSITVYNAAPDTPAADALKLLASWTATQDQETATAPAESER